MISRIAADLRADEASVSAAIELLDSQTSIQFAARYCRSKTGGLDEGQLRRVRDAMRYCRDLDERKRSVLGSIEERGKLTDTLREQIKNCSSSFELEDLYLPFKTDSSNPAAEARSKGLEPLAEYLWNQEPDAWSLEEHADVYIDVGKGIGDREEALQGACQIMAEWVSHKCAFRQMLRDRMFNEGFLVSKAVASRAGQSTKYAMYHDRREPVKSVPSHRLLAILRGTKERILASHIEIEDSKAIEWLLSKVISDAESIFAPWLELSTRDAYTRLLQPAIQKEVLRHIKESADQEAIQVFQENLANLLLSPPLGPMVVIGIDPGKGRQCPLAVVDGNGRPIDHALMIQKPPKEPTVDPANSAVSTEAAQAETQQPPTVETAHRPDSMDDPAAADTDATAPKEASPSAQQSNPETKDPVEAEVLTAKATAQTGFTLPNIPVQAAAQTEPAPDPGPGSPAPEGPVVSCSQSSLEATQEPDPDSRPPADTESSSPEQESEIAHEGSGTATPDVPTSEAENKNELSKESQAVEPSQAENKNELLKEPQPVEPSSAEALATKSYERSRALLKEMIAKHGAAAIAIGNGPTAREIGSVVRRILEQEKLENIIVAGVSDAGLSVYSSSRGAKAELPDFDIGTRNAVSIARRLQDPLLELTKIDPKLIGVGQYQHDVDQKYLRRRLLDTVRFCVNQIGVDANTAGALTLRYVAGFNETTARKLVSHREEHGPFPNRNALQDIPGLSERSYKEAAGFLRVRNSENPLDQTSVHPDYYPLVERMAKSAAVSVAELLGNESLIANLTAESLTAESCEDESHGEAQVEEVRAELRRSGRDPRRKFAVAKFRSDVQEISDLAVGMKLEGVISNVTNFGAFVDVGVHQDGLVHLSQMSNRFIRDPRLAVRVGDVVQVQVLSVDLKSRRIGLSMKALLPPTNRRSKRPFRGKRPEEGTKAPAKRLAKQASNKRAARGETSSEPRHGDAPELRGHRRRARRPKSQREASEAGASNGRADSPAKPDAPELSMQEKIAFLQSKFSRVASTPQPEAKTSKSNRVSK